MLEAQFGYTLNSVADFNKAKLLSIGSQIQLYIFFTGEWWPNHFQVNTNFGCLKTIVLRFQSLSYFFSTFFLILFLVHSQCAIRHFRKVQWEERFIWEWTNINISATLHYTAACYQIHVSAAKVCLIGFRSSKHLDLYGNLLLNVPNFQQAAVDAPTRNLALEWGTKYDIRLNGIAPGPIGDTPDLGWVRYFLKR